MAVMWSTTLRPGDDRRESAARRAEDIGGQELSYAEVKAIASGNPAVLTLAEADAELQRLAILKKNHADEQYLARRALRELPDTIARLTKRLADLSADLATPTAHERDPLTIGDRPCNRPMSWTVLGHRLDALPEKVRETRRFPLGRYRGLAFGLVLHPGGAADVFLEGAATRHGMLSRDHRGPRAVLNALDRLADSYPGQCDATPPGPGDRRRPAPRPRGPPRPPLPARRLPGRADRLTRPAQGRPVAGDARAGHAHARRRTGRADQVPESRPHHRRRPRTDRTPPHRRRGAGDRPHPPPERIGTGHRATSRARAYGNTGGDSLASRSNTSPRRGAAASRGDPSIPRTDTGRARPAATRLPAAGCPRPTEGSAALSQNGLSPGVVRGQFPSGRVQSWA